MSQDIAGLVVQLELQSAQFSSEMAKVNGQLNGLSRSVQGAESGMTKLGNVMKSALAVGAIIGGIKTLTDGILKISEGFDEMGKAAQKIGIATEALSGLKFAGEQSGVSFESLQGGIKKLAVGMSELDDATSKAGAVLRSAGVTSSDTTASAFDKVAESLSKLPDGYQKTAAAVALFGKSGSDLIPLLNEGGEGIKKMKDRAEELGLVMKGSTIAQLTLFNDSLSELGRASDGVKNKILEGLAPALAGIAQTMANSAKVSDAWVSFGKKIGEVMNNVSIDIKTVITDTKILYAAITSIGSRESWQNLGNEVAGIKEEHDQWVASLKRNTEAATQLTGTTDNLKTSVTNLGGSIKTSPFENWIEGLKKSTAEAELLAPKMKYVTLALGEMEAAGEKGSEQWRVYNAEMKKIAEIASQGSLGAELLMQIEKTREATTKASESMTILAAKYHDFLEMGDTEGAQIVSKMMNDLKSSTQEAASEFDKLAEGITQAIANNATNSVNKFIDSIGSAQVSFGDFAASVLKDIAKMVVQMLIMKPLMDSLRGFIGGFGGGGSVATAFPVTRGLPEGLGARAMPMPMLSEPIGSYPTGGNILSRSAPSVKSDTHINVYNTTGAEVTTKTTENSDGSKQIDLYIEKKVRDMVNGGGLDRSMRGAYGLTRVGA